jgi:hypothetical protein
VNRKKQSKRPTKEAIQILETVLPPRIVKFIESQISLHSTKSKNGHRYSSDMKAFSLTLYHLSGKAYKIVSKLFCLPTKSTLLKWVSRLPNCPGLTQPAIDVIASKVKTMTDNGKQCIISFDEMSLKKHLFYQSNTDELVGLEDYGDGTKTNCVATSAIVFMARGVSEKWKQPLAYYLVNESCSSSKVREKLLYIIDQVESIGLHVIAVVSDIWSNFQKFVREMHITPENPWFLHNGRKIAFLFDAPHIIKAMRNNLIKYDYHFDGKVASWRDIETLYKIDSDNTIRCCPKLTSIHLHPNGFQKMKVKYATQVLSHTVSAAMLTAVSSNLLPQSAAGTAELISHFDQIFNCLNSSSFKSRKIYNRPITPQSEHCTFMRDMCSFVKKIQIKDATGKDVTSTMKWLNALQTTFNATIFIWKSIESTTTFLRTRRLNQDPLENFFGTIRQKGGNCDTSTTVQFSRAFRQLFYDNYLSPLNGNCSADLDAILVGQKATAEKKDPPKQQDVAIESFDFHEADYQQPSIEANLMKTNAINYVTGYLLKKCLQQHQCQVCSLVLIHHELDSSDKMFCYFKAYDNKKGPYGGLTVPSTKLVQYITDIEEKLVQEFPSLMTKSGVGKHLVNTLPKFDVPECGEFPNEYLLKLFVRMRIYYILKFGNRELAQAKKAGAKKNRKYFKITHL